MTCIKKLKYEVNNKLMFMLQSGTKIKHQMLYYIMVTFKTV